MKLMEPEATHTREQLEQKIKEMKKASNAFYSLAVQIGNHPFIEFTGFMNEYIKLCQKALEEGIDFTQANVHTGKSLPMEDYEAAYVGEKFGCIFAMSFAGREDLFDAFKHSMMYGGH